MAKHAVDEGLAETMHELSVGVRLRSMRPPRYTKWLLLERRLMIPVAGMRCEIHTSVDWAGCIREDVCLKEYRSASGQGEGGRDSARFGLVGS